MGSSECVRPSIGAAAMTIRYEDRLLLSYAANLARRTSYSPEKADLLMREVYAGDSFTDIRGRAFSELCPD